MSSQSMGGHHCIFMVRCSDVLVSEFNIKKRYIHDLTVVGVESAAKCTEAITILFYAALPWGGGRV
jgi:hypothetical protein